MIFLANLVTQCPWHLVNRVRVVADKRRHLAKSRRLRCVREFGRDIPNLSDLNAIKNVLSTPFSLEVSSVRNQLITLSIRITIKMIKNNGFWRVSDSTGGLEGHQGGMEGPGRL